MLSIQQHSFYVYLQNLSTLHTYSDRVNFGFKQILLTLVLNYIFFPSIAIV